MPVEAEVGVGEVVDEHHLPLAREVDRALHERGVDDRGRRVVREREDDDARARLRALVRVDERVEEVVLEPHRHPGDARAGEDGRVDVDRVAGARDERGVAGPEQDPHQMREPFLRADRRRHLRFRVELDAPPLRGRGRRRPPAGAGCRDSPSSGGCAD